MAPLVIQQPTVVIHYETPTPTDVDLTCYAYGVDIASDTDSVDIGTFCAPNATENGRTTESIVINLLWEDALYDLLLPHKNQEGNLRFTPKPGTGAKSIQADVSFASLPWGAFTLGERVEADLNLAVKSEITYGVVTP